MTLISNFYEATTLYYVIIYSGLFPLVMELSTVSYIIILFPSTTNSAQLFFASFLTKCYKQAYDYDICQNVTKISCHIISFLVYVDL